MFAVMTWTGTYEAVAAKTCRAKEHSFVYRVSSRSLREH